MSSGVRTVIATMLVLLVICFRRVGVEVVPKGIAQVVEYLDLGLRHADRSCTLSTDKGDAFLSLALGFTRKAIKVTRN